MVAQGLKILQPLPQGRHGDGDYVEPVVQVLPEGALRDLFLQIGVGEGQEPDVQLNGSGAADTGDLLGLDGPQQLYLQVDGHVPDFVQQQGAVVGVLKQADFSLGIGSGKGPLFVAEQLRLQQMTGDGGAVDLHIGLVLPPAAPVDLIRHHLLAHAGLAGDEHRGVGGGDVVDQGIDGLQRAVFPHHAVGEVLVGVLGDVLGPERGYFLDKGLKILLQIVQRHNGAAAGHHLPQAAVGIEDGGAHHVAHQGLPGLVGGGQTEGAFAAFQHAGHSAAGKQLVLSDQGVDIPVQHVLAGDAGVAGVGGVDVEHHAGGVCDEDAVVQAVHHFLEVDPFVVKRLQPAVNFLELGQQLRLADLVHRVLQQRADLPNGQILIHGVSLLLRTGSLSIIPALSTRGPEKGIHVLFPNCNCAFSSRKGVLRFCNVRRRFPRFYPPEGRKMYGMKLAHTR